MTHFSYTRLLTHISQFSRFGFLNLGLSPFPSAKFCLSANTQATATNLPFYDISVAQKVPLLKIFDDVIACGLGPSQSKILATPKPILHGVGYMLPISNFYTKSHGNTEFDMRFGVLQNFLERLVLSS